MLLIYSLTALALGAPPDLRTRTEGLLLGSLIGDAAGGPMEFAPPQRGSLTSGDGRALSAIDLRELARTFRLQAYTKLAEPYAQWKDSALPGTVTDDTRHKIILLNALRTSGPKFNAADLARQYVSYWRAPEAEYLKLSLEWLNEYGRAALFQLGADAGSGALPPDRLWGGIPTNYGQMAFLPLAAQTPGDFAATYLRIWNLDFMETGVAKDMTAATVSGLSRALLPGADWEQIQETMRTVDPFQYGNVPWVKRSVDNALDRAQELALRSGRNPAKLFRLLEEEFHDRIWWEAQIPLVVVFSIAPLCEGEPLACMQLVLEFGHDTDSYAQLMGAFLGAMAGPDIFPAEMRATLRSRLKLDYSQDVTEWLRLLGYGP